MTMFTQRFNELLSESTITQVEIARSCNCSKQNISNFKAGRSFPSIDTLYLICKCFNVSSDYLLGLSDY